MSRVQVLTSCGEPLHADFAREALTGGAAASTAAEPALLEQELALRRPRALVTDAAALGAEPLERLAQLRATWPELVLVLLDAGASLDTLALARLGVRLVRPGLRGRTDLDRLVEDLDDQVHVPSDARPSPLDDFAGSSQAITTFRARLLRAARGALPVLLVGSPGSGKDLAARCVHALSPRAGGPWVPFRASEVRPADAGARLAEALHEGGDGTVHVEDVEHLPEDAQPVLLRHLLRAERALPRASARVTAASVLTPSAAERNGWLLPPLAWRLEAASLRVPGLDERPDDLPALASRLVERACERTGRAPSSLSPDALARLERHAWPQGVRELEGVLERALVLSAGRDVILADDILLERAPARAGRRSWLPPEGVDLPHLLAQVEHGYIREALARCGQSRQQAADLLHLQRTTLVQKLRRMGSAP